MLLQWLEKHWVESAFFKPERRQIAWTWLYIALTLLAVEYWGWQRPFIEWARAESAWAEHNNNWWLLLAQVWTSSSFLLCFALLPSLWAFTWNKVSPPEEKCALGLALPEWRIVIESYLPLLLIMLPLLWWACSAPSFYQFYPLYRPDSLANWALFESIYLTQFFAVEFFFRGFALFRMERAFPGYGAILMTLPYALIHIHKPFPEALGSIVAGLVLGKLALKGKSIWPGVLVHMVIAFSADAISLFYSGVLQQII